MDTRMHAQVGDDRPLVTGVDRIRRVICNLVQGVMPLGVVERE